MIPSLLKRALPFVLTLIAGTGLGNFFGVPKSPGGGGPGRFEIGHHRRMRNGTRPLRILFQPDRRYTLEAKENRTTGVVRLLVTFNPDGTTTVVERLSTLPDGLTEEAERVAEQTRFIPAMLKGQPIAETKEMNYIFSLSDTNSVDP